MKLGRLFSKATLGAIVGGVIGGIPTLGLGAGAGAAAGAALAGGSDYFSQQQEAQAAKQLDSNYNTWMQMSKEQNPYNKQTYDPQYFNQVVEYARSPNDSKWLTMTKEKLAKDQIQRTGDIAAQVQSNQNSAMDQLAMRGGLRRGDANRLAESGSLAQLMAKQRLAAETSARSFDASIAEQQNKQNILSQLPGFEMNRSQGELRNLLDKYKTDMSAWAAHQQGLAMLNSGGGGLLG